MSQFCVKNVAILRQSSISNGAKRFVEVGQWHHGCGSAITAISYNN